MCRRSSTSDRGDGHRRQGHQDVPLFYYAMTAPATPPDLLTQLTMRSTGGDRSNGTYAVTVPNPVAQMPAGTKRTVYYVFVANDNDDTAGTCNHDDVAGVHDVGDVDRQTNADLRGVSACLYGTARSACAWDRAARALLAGVRRGCPAATCSTTPVTSVDGASAPQCVPQAGRADDDVGCTDDSWEVNDTQSVRRTTRWRPADLISCPARPARRAPTTTGSSWW
jgi:hypothetical protein